MGLSKLLRAALTVNPLARTTTAKKLATTRTQLEKILQEGSEATAAERKNAREKLKQMNKVEAGENVQRQAKQSKAAPEGTAKKKKLAPPSLKSLEGLPDNFSKGGKATKKVPVISIGVGMAEMPKGKKKTKMMRGGMSGGKEHMYAAGGMVKDNPGLKALKAASPMAYSKITGK